ncbi:hypothetical protein CLOM_g15788 [Closterium sp. NIES-68]|nr:hypothetical protein CLOM_g15788 [Closterium sp. NIES-68]GJP78762.1 hypothetical protein CLOP_g9037 [Closterium sp. NIES-67]
MKEGEGCRWVGRDGSTVTGSVRYRDFMRPKTRTDSLAAFCQLAGNTSRAGGYLAMIMDDPLYGTLDPGVVWVWAEYHRVRAGVERFLFYNMAAWTPQLTALFLPYFAAGVAALTDMAGGLEASEALTRGFEVAAVRRRGFEVISRVVFRRPDVWCVRDGAQEEIESDVCEDWRGHRKLIVNPRKTSVMSVHAAREPQKGGVVLNAGTELRHFHLAGVVNPVNVLCHTLVPPGESHMWFVRDTTIADQLPLLANASAPQPQPLL